MHLDRRIQAIIARLDGAAGGEALAALAALERLLPPKVSLADVVYVGLHHMRQDLTDTSLAIEARRLAQGASEAARREERLRRRIEELERAVRQSLADLAEARRA